MREKHRANKVTAGMSDFPPSNINMFILDSFYEGWRSSPVKSNRQRLGVALFLEFPITEQFTIHF